MRLLKYVLPLWCLCCLPVALAQVSTVFWPTQYDSLADTHGNKMATGRYNTLHVVFEKGSYIRYTTSLDGVSWTTPVGINSGASAGKNPAIAVDSYGTIGVVWTANIGGGGLGQIWYAYKPYGGSWTAQKIVNSGAQPAIAARGNRVYITWTTFDVVQYTGFPTTAPPAAINFGEELESDGCPSSGYAKPSIAVVNKPCKSPEVRIAYLRYSDEVGNPDPGCGALETEIGARVCVRDNDTATWSLEYDNVIADIGNTNGVSPMSLSLNANYNTGDVYLAWSDLSDTAERTMIAHGKGGTWTDQLYNSAISSVHIAAKQGSAANGAFRVTYVPDGGYFGLWMSYNAYYRDGSWAGASPLTWSFPEINFGGWGPLWSRPQGHYWKRCSGGMFSDLHWISAKEVACTSPELVTDFDSVTGCPPNPIIGIGALPCHKYQVYAAPMEVGDGVEIHVDASDWGVLVEYDEQSAVFQIDVDRYAQLRWTEGSPVASSESGLVLKTSQGKNFQGSLSTSDGTPILWDLSTSTYKGATTPGTCTIRQSVEVR